MFIWLKCEDDLYGKLTTNGWCDKSRRYDKLWENGETKLIFVYILTWSRMVGVNLIAYTLSMQNIKTVALKFKFDRFIGNLF